MLDMLSNTANILILSIPGVVLLEDVDFAAALECSSSQVVPAKKSAKKGSGVCDFDFLQFVHYCMREFNRNPSLWVVGNGKVPSGGGGASGARATLIVCPLSVLNNWLVSA